MPWTHCTPRTFLRSLQPSHGLHNEPDADTRRPRGCPCTEADSRMPNHTHTRHTAATHPTASSWPGSVPATNRKAGATRRDRPTRPVHRTWLALLHPHSPNCSCSFPPATSPSAPPSHARSCTAPAPAESPCALHPDCPEHCTSNWRRGRKTRARPVGPSTKTRAPTTAHPATVLHPHCPPYITPASRTPANPASHAQHRPDLPTRPP